MSDSEGRHKTIERMRETALNLEHHLNAGFDDYQFEVARLLQSLHDDFDRLEATKIPRS
jgi:hypothetical protein